MPDRMHIMDKYLLKASKHLWLWGSPCCIRYTLKHQWLCMRLCWSASKHVAMDKPMTEQVHHWRHCSHG